MWTMLAGVPGKLKTLLDRLTAARAGYLDRLDATISSRAAASTALSNATWTNTRAGKLDLIKQSPVDSPPAADGLSGAVLSYTSPPDYRVVGGAQFTTGSTTLVTALSVTGAGVLNFLTVTGGSDIGAQVVITIDGVVALNTTFSGAAAQSTTMVIVGAFMQSYSIALDQVPFRSSLLVQVRATGSSRTVTVVSKHRAVTL